MAQCRMLHPIVALKGFVRCISFVKDYENGCVHFIRE